jgi:hypothetical protein
VLWFLETYPKAEPHDIAEILIKLVLNTNQSTHYLLRAFPGKKYLGGWNSSIIWGTTTRILIIFGVPPHKYKYLK